MWKRILSVARFDWLRSLAVVYASLMNMKQTTGDDTVEHRYFDLNMFNLESLAGRGSEIAFFANPT